PLYQPRSAGGEGAGAPAAGDEGRQGGRSRPRRRHLRRAARGLYQGTAGGRLRRRAARPIALAGAKRIVSFLLRSSEVLPMPPFSAPKTLLIASLVALGAMTPALAQTPTGVWVHAASVNGTPKYAEGFTHFDYVNADAPKAGLLRLSARGSFDTFNPLLPKGQAASGLGLVYETLFTPSLDEVNVSYGLLAEAMKIADDYS